MKSFFKLIFISLIILFLCPVNLFAEDLPVQPMPDEVLADILNNISRDENNASTDVPVTDTSADNDTTQQGDQDDSGTSQTDTDGIDIDDIDEIIDQLSNNIISCIDTYNHRLFLAEKENNRVLVFNLNPDNTLIDNIADHVLGQPDFLTITPGTTDAKFNMPQGIAYDHEDNLLFVADTGNNRIMVFDVSLIDNGESATNVLGQITFTENDPGTTDSELNNPVGLVYDSDNDQLFVADTGNNRIMVFDVSLIDNGESATNVLGQTIFTENDPGTTDSELNNPVGLVYNSDSDQLFVADTGNNRIMVFDVSSIDNGESATNVIDQSQDLSFGKNIAGKSGTDQPKNNLFWIIFLSLIIISVSVFLLVKIIRAKN